MCSMLELKCPLCAQSNFPSIDALRLSLIKVANGPLVCPICHELFLGLDKLTIHLFSHTSAMTTPAVTTAATTATTQPAPDTAVTVETADTSTGGLPTSKRAPREKKSKKSRSQSDVPILTTEQKISDSFVTHTSVPQLAALNTSVGALDTTSTAIPTSNIFSPSTSALSTCDICELTFRDADLRDMHFRLVHRNLSAITMQEAASSSTTSNEPDFKCHLCTKTFKSKGSLRVHLKVVHLMSLLHMGNTQKLSICDRIRHKESNKKLSNASIGATMPAKVDNQPQTSVVPPNAISSCPQQTTLLQTQPLPQQSCNVAISSTNNAPPTHNGFTFGTLTLLPTTAGLPGNILNIGGNSAGGVDGAMVHAAVDGTALNSNVLLLFSTNAATEASESAVCASDGTITPTSASTFSNDVKIENKTPNLDMDMQGKSGAIMGNPKTWECDVCAKSFTTKYFLKKHKRLHTGEMPYTCEICARTFTFQQSYHKHLLYHSNEKPHVCGTCGRAFKELSTLHNHERIHSGEKPFKCEVCGKCFRQRVSFLVHTRIHTGVKPYKCEMCEKSFRYKVSQRTHKCPASAESSASTSATSNEIVENDPECNQPVDLKPTVEEISECFIKEFLEKTKAHISDAQCSPTSAEISAITGGGCHDNGQVSEALLTKTIDDIVVESCNKLGIGSHVATSHTSAPHLSPRHNQSIDDGCNSPIQKFQNMRLYSPQLVSELIEDTVVNGDLLPRFLLEDTETTML